jgi:hypothetical protein
MSQTTETDTAPSAQILRGEQLGTGFSTGGIEIGCTATFPPAPKACPTWKDNIKDDVPVSCIPSACLAVGVIRSTLTGTYGPLLLNDPQDLIPPEQGLYNILFNALNGTPAAPAFKGISGTVPDNYLQMYSFDIDYTNNHSMPALIVEHDGTMIFRSAQCLLDLAQSSILAISEPRPVITQITGPSPEPNVIGGPGSIALIQGSNLSPIGFDTFNSGSQTQLRGVSVTVDGKAANVNQVSPTLVRILTPLSDLTGPVPVQITVNGSTSDPFLVQVRKPSVLPPHQ